MSELTLLVVGDTHFLDSARAEPSDPTRECRLAGELLQRAVLDARRRGGFDAVVLLGDMVDAGQAPGADRDVAVIEQILHEASADVPRIIVPGNHDGDVELVLSIFSERPGMREVGGYRIYNFADRWDERNVCLRTQDEMQRFAQQARASDDKPLIVVQHNPLHPPIESDYPFMPPNRDAIMSAYSDAGVLLSLSGHYHAGQPLCESGGVLYYTCPALCESPFRYALVRLHGREVDVSEHQLRHQDNPPLFDVHSHTQYAYCGRGVSATEVIRRAGIFGLAGVCLTEHADQLYATRQEHDSGYGGDHPDFWCAPRSNESERMPRYRAEITPLRSDFVKLALEVELDAVGRPTLRQSDRDGWDMLIGSMHWIPGGVSGLSLDEVKRRFMRDTERILRFGVAVLAHPFRFFRRSDLAPPRDLYRPVARLLAQYGAAAEINFHCNQPDPEFFAICIERGVKIALGTDTHELWEAGDLHPHLSVLRAAAGREDVTDLLFPPPAVKQ